MPVIDPEELEQVNRLRPIALPRAEMLGLDGPAMPSNADAVVGDSGRLRPLSDAEVRHLPTSSPGAPVGSAGNLQARLAKLQEPDTLASHDTRLGKIGHVLGRIGNIAGDIVAPAEMRLIPGTDLNKAGRAEELQNQLETAEGKEETARHNRAEENIGEGRNEAARAKSEQAQQKELDSLAEHGLTRDENGEIVPLSEDKLPANVRQKMADQKNMDALRTAQTNLADAKEELARAQNDPKSPAYQLASRKLQMAQMAHDIALQNLQLHEKQFENKVQEQELVKPSGQAQSRGSAAQAAMDVLPELEKQIRSNAAQLGPIMGRLAKGEIKIGDVDPSIAKLYSALTSFYALNPAIHGFRNFEFVKDMPSFIGGLERDPEATIAGLEGLRPTLESVAKEGKTFHKRQVEGRDDKKNETPAANEGKSDFGSFMADRNKDKKQKPQ